MTVSKEVDSAITNTQVVTPQNEQDQAHVANPKGSQRQVAEMWDRYFAELPPPSLAKRVCQQISTFFNGVNGFGSERSQERPSGFDIEKIFYRIKH